MNFHDHKLWYRHAILYHIYPLSFADSNGDGYGDLKGILRHLDYLNDGTADSLGVGAIWLSPIYRSPMADWGYDVVDHTAIDPRFGTMRDFDRLLAEIHRRGMKLLMDYVPNHTSHQHKWFLASRSSRSNAKRDWYIWADPATDGGPPNNWLSYFGGSAWEWDEATGQYYLHTFLPEQPDLNWRSPKVREVMLDVLQFWLDKGVDGFRTDAVYGVVKDAQLRNDPPDPRYRAGVSYPTDKFLRVHSAGQRELNEVLGSFCDVLARKAGRYLLSEVYLNIPGLHTMYEACAQHPVHAPFNFNLMTLPWSARVFRDFIDQYEHSLGPNDWPNYVLGNHDVHRLVTRIGPDRARLLALLQLTLRGLPVVYYGEELGLTDANIRPHQAKDPRGIRVPGYGLGRDPERTPMPWTSEDKGGFTTGKPWLPFAQPPHLVNVELQQRQPNSCFNLYLHLIQLRVHSPALNEGVYRSVDLDNNEVYAFVRETKLQRFSVVLNFGKHSTKVVLKAPVGTWIAGTHEVEGDGLVPADNAIRLAPHEGRVYELRRGAN